MVKNTSGEVVISRDKYFKSHGLELQKYTEQDYEMIRNENAKSHGIKLHNHAE